MPMQRSARGASLARSPRSCTKIMPMNLVQVSCRLIRRRLCGNSCSQLWAVPAERLVDRRHLVHPTWRHFEGWSSGKGTVPWEDGPSFEPRMHGHQRRPSSSPSFRREQLRALAVQSTLDKTALGNGTGSQGKGKRRCATLQQELCNKSSN